MAQDTRKIRGLKDSFERTLNYLRVSVTDKCNLNCTYCVSGRPMPKLGRSDILRYEDILRIVGVGAGLGINKVRITGGEPLIRRNITDFLHRLTQTPGLSDVSLTTNGMRLASLLPEIQAAGIKRLNISLDSLKSDRYHAITGVDGFKTVWGSMMAAFDMGFSPIKINVVAIPEVNGDELVDFARLTLAYPFHVRFIEYMPIGNPSYRMSRRLLSGDIRQRIEALGPLIPIENGTFDGPARRFRFEGAMGEIGLISPVSQHFCQTCNRFRLTADGRLRLCLLSDETLPMGDIIRKGGSDEEIREMFEQAARLKMERHTLDREDSQRAGIQDFMSSIGG